MSTNRQLMEVRALQEQIEGRSANQRRIDNEITVLIQKQSQAKVDRSGNKTGTLDAGGKFAIVAPGDNHNGGLPPSSSVEGGVESSSSGGGGAKDGVQKAGTVSPVVVGSTTTTTAAPGGGGGGGGVGVGPLKVPMKPRYIPPPKGGFYPDHKPLVVQYMRDARAEEIRQRERKEKAERQRMRRKEGHQDAMAPETPGRLPSSSGRRTSNTGKGGKGGGATPSNPSSHSLVFTHQVEPEEPEKTGLQPRYVESLFARDVWQQVHASEARVRYCKGGGNSQGEEFNKRPAQSHYSRQVRDEELKGKRGHSPTVQLDQMRQALGDEFVVFPGGGSLDSSAAQAFPVMRSHPGRRGSMVGQPTAAAAGLTMAPTPAERRLLQNQKPHLGVHSSTEVTLGVGSPREGEELLRLKAKNSHTTPSGKDGPPSAWFLTETDVSNPPLSNKNKGVVQTARQPAPAPPQGAKGTKGQPRLKVTGPMTVRPLKSTAVISTSTTTRQEDEMAGAAQVSPSLAIGEGRTPPKQQQHAKEELQHASATKESDRSVSEVPGGGLSRHPPVPPPWVCKVSLHELRDIESMAYLRTHPISTLDDQARLVPEVDHEMATVAKIIASSNQDFRRMIHYRTQDIGKRDKEVVAKHKEKCKKLFPSASSPPSSRGGGGSGQDTASAEGSLGAGRKFVTEFTEPLPMEESTEPTEQEKSSNQVLGGSSGPDGEITAVKTAKRVMVMAQEAVVEDGGTALPATANGIQQDTVSNQSLEKPHISHEKRETTHEVATTTPVRRSSTVTKSRFHGIVSPPDAHPKQYHFFNTDVLEEPVDGGLQHEMFERLLKNHRRELFKHGATEIHRWVEDRERLYDMKFLRMDVSQGDISWERTLAGIRSNISTALEGEFSAERCDLQKEFFDKFKAQVIGLFSFALSEEGAEVLDLLHTRFYSQTPFGAKQLSSLINSVSLDFFLVTDVISIFYSLGAGLGIDEVAWLKTIKARTQFLDQTKQSTTPPLPDESDLAKPNWVAKLNASQLSKETMVWSVGRVAASTLTKDEVQKLVRSFQLTTAIEVLTQLGPAEVHPEVVAQFEAMFHSTQQSREIARVDPQGVLANWIRGMKKHQCEKDTRSRGAFTQ